MTALGWAEIVAAVGMVTLTIGQPFEAAMGATILVMMVVAALGFWLGFSF